MLAATPLPLQRYSQWCGSGAAELCPSRKAPDTNVGVAKHAAGIIGSCQGARSPGLARAEVASGPFWCDPVTPSSIVGSPCGRDARSAAAA